MALSEFNKKPPISLVPDCEHCPIYKGKLEQIEKNLSEVNSTLKHGFQEIIGALDNFHSKILDAYLKKDIAPKLLNIIMLVLFIVMAIVYFKETGGKVNEILPIR